MDGTNWYVYCGNNPIMFVDPWGLSVNISPEEQELYNYYKFEIIQNSPVGRALFDMIESEQIGEVHISFRSDRNFTLMYYKDGEDEDGDSFESMSGHRINFIGNTNEGRYATVSINPDINDLEATVLSFVHELAHAAMWVYEVDQQIYIDKSRAFDGVWLELFNGYTEAFAISTQYMVRDELSKYNSRYAKSKANMYYIEDGFYCYDEIKENGIFEQIKYGAFPNTLSKSAHMKLIYTHRLDLFYKMYLR